MGLYSQFLAKKNSIHFLGPQALDAESVRAKPGSGAYWGAGCAPACRSRERGPIKKIRGRSSMRRGIRYRYRVAASDVFKSPFFLKDVGLAI